MYVNGVAVEIVRKGNLKEKLLNEEIEKKSTTCPECGKGYIIRGLDEEGIKCICRSCNAIWIVKTKR